jgi:GAF domain-containing protein
MSAMPDSTLADPQQIIAELRQQLAECRAQRGEALEQQTATAEVLQVINSSPGDLAPVFDTILEKAHFLCGAPLGSLVLHEGDQLRAVATRGYPQEYSALARQGFSPTPTFRLFLSGEPFVHVLDGSEPPTAFEDHPIRRAAAEIAGIRTVLFIPLRKDATVLGYLSAQRQEVRPFTEKQIALLQNFAVQAVIAMENARLLTETREALEQQTATAEVLQVINSSPGDLSPVFDAMLEKAMLLGRAAFGGLFIREGDRLRAVATRGLPDRLNDYVRQGFSGSHRLARVAEVEHIPDLMNDPLAHRPARAAAVELGGARTMLSVPLHRDDTVFGYFSTFAKRFGLSAISRSRCCRTSRRRRSLQCRMRGY